MEPPSPLPGVAPDDGPNPGVRAFWTAFALCVAPPLLMLALTTVITGDDVYGVLILGAGATLLMDVAMLLLGLARGLRGGRGAWATFLGALTGALLGFGGCSALLGLV